jgi:apolipoprotein N-acyltransferase
LPWLKVFPTGRLPDIKSSRSIPIRKDVLEILQVFLKGWIILLAAGILSGISLFAAFPPYGFPYLVWIGMVPFFLAVAGRNPLAAFFLSWIWGCTFFLGIFTWILTVGKYTYLHHAILIVYLGAYFAVFGLLFTVIYRRLGILAAFAAAPFIWVALEYLRANLSFMALPWGLFAHSQYQQPLIIQIAAIAGTYGVSFLIVLVNVTLAMLLRPLIVRPKNFDTESPAQPIRKSIVTFAVSVAALFLLNAAYGYVVLSNPPNGNPVKVAVVQGNIEQWQKWDRKYAPMIMQIYGDLTMAAAKDHPDLIVWPETATPRALNSDPKLNKRVRQIAESAGTYLLLGSSQVYKFKRNDPKSAKVKNSAYLVPADPSLKLTQQYDKIRLFPFGEYLPYKKKIPWSYINVPDAGNYIRGKEQTIFELPEFQFGVTICWENLFGDFVRRLVKRGAQFIVNMTNEAWFGRTGAPYQFVSMNVFRAVENRVFVIRCANTGVSCFIDPYGRVVSRVKDADGYDVFIRGFQINPVLPLQSHTLYTRYGDWFAWFCTVVAMIFAIIAVLRRQWPPANRVA